MQIDRTLQKEILETAKEYYPNPIYRQSNESLWEKDFFAANAFYLGEHGLLDIDHRPSHRSSSEPVTIKGSIKITSKGIDFLEDDGGLSAILNKVIIKFDEEDLSKLLAARLDKSDIPEKDKKTIMATLKSLPAEGIKTVYTHLLNQGLKHVQDIPQLIQSISDNL